MSAPCKTLCSDHVGTCLIDCPHYAYSSTGGLKPPFREETRMSEQCCHQETRNLNGGCDNCGDSSI